MLFALLDAWSERRRHELHEQGTVAALAHHDPQGLGALERAPDDDEVEDPIAEYRRRRKERAADGD